MYSLRLICILLQYLLLSYILFLTMSTLVVNLWRAYLYRPTAWIACAMNKGRHILLFVQWGNNADLCFWQRHVNSVHSRNITNPLRFPLDETTFVAVLKTLSNSAQTNNWKWKLEVCVQVPCVYVTSVYHTQNVQIVGLLYKMDSMMEKDLEGSKHWKVISYSIY